MEPNGLSAPTVAVAVGSIVVLFLPLFSSSSFFFLLCSVTSINYSFPVYLAMARQCRKGGKGAKEKRRKKDQRQYLSKVQRLRAVEIRDRKGVPGAGKMVGPIMNDAEPRLLSATPGASPQTREFYYEHQGGLLDIRVTDDGEENISNPEGVKGLGRGVKAARDIQAGTRLCPYVGHARSTPCKAALECKYCLRLDKDCYMCAREHLYDVCYLVSLDYDTRAPGVYCESQCPPNYARYINSVFADADGSEPPDSAFNVEFDIVDDGFDVMFIKASRDIKQDEELLIDYGGQFNIN